MIKLIQGLPDNVLGIVATGKMTRRDCAEVLVPALEKAGEWHHRLRLYYEVRSRFPGAAWDEMQLGVAQSPIWERIALVSDVGWLKHTVRMLQLVIPGDIRVFATDQTPDALAWIVEAKRRRRATNFLPSINAANGSSRTFLPAHQFLHQAM